MSLLKVEDLNDVYGQYLEKEGIKDYIDRSSGENSTWFSASSAGHCYKKHKFKLLKTETDKFPVESLLKMRLGNLFHDDVQKALIKYFKKGFISTEYLIENEDMNVRGFIDILIIDSIIEVDDIKTISSYQYRKKFGRKENRDKVQSDKYELQVGTYAVAMQKKLGREVNSMNIIYYKKDDSTIKIVPVSHDYKEKALEYWDNVGKECKKEIDELVPGDYGIPFESWECKFCQYASKCNSPFKKK